MEATVPATSVTVGDSNRDGQRDGQGFYREWSTAGQVATGFTAAALASAKTDDFVQGEFARTQRQAAELAASVLASQASIAAAQSVQQANDTNLIQVQAQSIGGQLTNQATSNFNGVTTQVNLMQYNILLDSQKNAAAGVLLATQLAAAAAAKAAECCCELKSAILADGQKTRDLINQNTIEALRTRTVILADAYNAAYIGKVAPVTPITTP
jgi:hypothetical protein